MSPASRRAFVRCSLAIATAAVLSGCSLTPDISGPSTIIKTSGDQQTAPVNTVLPTAFVVTVVDQFGQTISGVTVTWAIVSGGGSLSVTNTVTDGSGNASVIYTTGSTAGQAVIRASGPNGLFISFTATIT
jgi:ABC-type glycerol-3-phosphate transport system substrate-binding protein